MPINDALLATSDTSSDLLPFKNLLMAVPGLHSHLDKLTDAWRAKTSRSLQDQFPYQAQVQAFDRWRSLPVDKKTSGPDLRTAADDYLALCLDVGRPESASYWSKLFEPKQSDSALAASLRSTFISPNQLEFQWQKCFKAIKRSY